MDIEAAVSLLNEIASVRCSPQLAKFFGAKEGDDSVSTIGHLVKSFKFKLQLPSVPDIATEANDKLKTELAPCFGDLTDDAFASMDEDLKFIIGAANLKLAAAPVEKGDWDTTYSIFLQSTFLTPIDVLVSRSDKFMEDGSNYFRIKEDITKSTARKVESWFQNFIADEDVKFDLKVFVDIVATTSAAIERFKDFFYTGQYKEKEVVDIGVLRYPDLDNPRFKLYRIRLIAWSDCRHEAKYDVHCFAPNRDIIGRMSEKAKDISELDDFLLKREKL
ncbi:hypothetical protein SCHPADRAFT_909729 [Schizopora paradoxa]|uniref:Uncharacterized protein n=1 Tax=Schizopora paradoxa TaxID=27342 RepID=A0A0H2R5X1_9AGAM|nr:hypothetical protein SCHPADRAFT_909729 [Schizopora paradoxa]